MQLVGMLRHGTCLSTRRWLNDLCDGELDTAADHKVRRHLAGCARCRRAVERLRATIADVAALRHIPVPNGTPVADQVAERIRRSP